MKKVFKAVTIAIVCAVFTACARGAQGVETAGNTGVVSQNAELNIAYQYGLAYAPLIIAKEQGLIEKKYQEITGNSVKVTWNQMSAGADINTGIASGDIQVGFMGIAPAITGITNKVGYKIFTNLSGQEHGLMTNDENITSLADLVGSNNQIALVNIGSIQHIILARALDHAGYDAHALDSNLVAMKHPDGMTSLEAGSVSCHLTTNPYIYKEREEDNLHEVEGISDVWSARSSFIVGVASTELYNNDQELYKALCSAIEEAIAYINKNPEEAAQITHEYNSNTVEDELTYMQAGVYATETSGIFEVAKFMADVNFIEQAPGAYADLVFDNVRGD